MNSVRVFNAIKPVH